MPEMNLENLTAAAFQILSNASFAIYPTNTAVYSVAGNRIN
jgi:hypothetical protein